MLGTIYVGMAGMNAYSKGLDVISNNVANLNTTGYKAGVASFAEVVYRNGAGAMRGSSGATITGAGVHVNAEQQNFRQGEMRQTNNSLDAALDGNGFFVFDRDGQRYYSRAGQFEFDKDGFLTDRISGARVMVSSESNSLGSLQIDPYRVFQPRATTEVKLAGNLARTGNSTFDLTNLDRDGLQRCQANPQGALRPRGRPEQHPDGNRDDTGTADDTETTPPALTWKVEVLDSDNNVLGSGTLVFNSDGTPAGTNTAISPPSSPRTCRNSLSPELR